MKKLKHDSIIDKQLQEFEEKDLGEDIRKSNSGVVFKPKRQMRTSIFLDQDLVSVLVKKAEKRKIGYQTMMKIIVAENVSHY